MALTRQNAYRHVLGVKGSPVQIQPSRRIRCHGATWAATRPSRGSVPPTFRPVLLSYRCATIVVMAVRKKRSISMPPDLDAEIAAAAARAGMSYSAWLADTARKEFAIRAGLAAVSQFERDHGTFTPEEVAAAEEWAATALERASRAGSSTGRRTA